MAIIEKAKDINKMRILKKPKGAKSSLLRRSNVNKGTGKAIVDKKNPKEKKKDMQSYKYESDDKYLSNYITFNSQVETRVTIDSNSSMSDVKSIENFMDTYKTILYNRDKVYQMLLRKLEENDYLLTKNGIKLNETMKELNATQSMKNDLSLVFLKAKGIVESSKMAKVIHTCEKPRKYKERMVYHCYGVPKNIMPKCCKPLKDLKIKKSVASPIATRFLKASTNHVWYFDSSCYRYKTRNRVCLKEFRANREGKVTFDDGKE
ncbi:hypothetical protein Goklo_023658, partial [Gossypium klotzschianum]|nr:hypothetical protein [Gossypium klotzschianum]